MAKRIVLYHDDADGFCAAWAAWKKLGDTAEYHPVNYGQPFPDVRILGAELYILDFSFPRETLERLGEVCARVVVLDHHKTAAADLRGLFAGHPVHRVVFRQDRSGSALAWWYFHREGDRGAPLPEGALDRADAPELVRYVDDRDLWRFALPHSHAINAAISAVPRDFPEWDELARSLEVLRTRNRLISGGEWIEQWTRTRAQEQAGKAARCLFRLGPEDPTEVSVRVTNAILLVSEIAGELAAGEPFGVTWFERVDGARVVSLRSDADGLDVAAIAKAWGGGGHTRAAGFTVGPAGVVPVWREGGADGI